MAIECTEGGQAFPIRYIRVKLHTGKAARSQRCCLDQADETFHTNGSGGKTLDLVQQHGKQHPQAFSAVTAAYEM